MLKAYNQWKKKEVRKKKERKKKKGKKIKKVRSSNIGMLSKIHAMVDLRLTKKEMSELPEYQAQK